MTVSEDVEGYLEVGLGESLLKQRLHVLEKLVIILGTDAAQNGMQAVIVLLYQGKTFIFIGDSRLQYPQVKKFSQSLPVGLFA